MTEIKAVLFDYGNVLCMPQADDDLAAMARCLDADVSRITTVYWQLRDEYDLGTLDGRAYWCAIAAKLGREASDEQLARLIELDNLSWTRPNHTMARWASQLQEQGIKTAILSNMPISIRQYLRDVEWLPDFDHYTFSCDVNAVKPEAEIYRHCLEGVRHRAENSLFIDDRRMNTDAATMLGIRSVIFTNVEALSDYVTSIGLPAIQIA